jgi:hypothetical protein
MADSPARLGVLCASQACDKRKRKSGEEGGKAPKDSPHALNLGVFPRSRQGERQDRTRRNPISAPEPHMARKSRLSRFAAGKSLWERIKRARQFVASF